MGIRPQLPSELERIFCVLNAQCSNYPCELTIAVWEWMPKRSSDLSENYQEPARLGKKFCWKGPWFSLGALCAMGKRLIDLQLL